MSSVPGPAVESTKIVVTVTPEIRDYVQTTLSEIPLSAAFCCPLCSEAGFADAQPTLKHLLLSHKLVVAHAEQIADLVTYDLLTSWLLQ